ncbi:unnamed protein product [Oppiella nova]|uniref:Nidogen G2 beta-barrel domain-containing protein n=1 Tax=Oppiella nova TaxID=334625 RepID=A0A7R9LLD8_9ACAR|nr:unnamed protein product [Oppiella nova]CAG2164803.1 unnamed protein product [Oppiella nova]
MIDGVDLHAYIVTEEGRTYTAISRIPQNVGFDLQTISTIGSVIGWLFASTKSGAPNGFMLTGGIFNRTAEVDFPQTGHRIYISEQFLGPDVFNFLKVNVQIRGSLPSVPFESKVEVDDYLEEFTRVSPGVIRSHATHSFRFGQNSLNIPIVIDQTITYEECQYAPVDEKLSTLQLNVARNYIVYDSKEQIVRYASTSKTAFLSADDPCRTGNAQCGTHSSCVVDGLSFKCICDRGYHTDYVTDAQNELRPSRQVIQTELRHCIVLEDIRVIHTPIVLIPTALIYVDVKLDILAMDTTVKRKRRVTRRAAQTLNAFIWSKEGLKNCFQ